MEKAGPTRRVRQRPPAEVAVHDSVLTVTGSLYGSELSDRKVISTHEFATNPAYVRVSSGITKNMGDYESLRVDVSLSVPCYVEEIDTVVPAVAEAVLEHLNATVDHFISEDK